MKVAIYYDNRFGRNDGPPLYYFHQLQEILGKENVHHLIPGEVDVDKWGPYDYHFWVDWGEDALLGKDKALALRIPNDGGETIYVVSDAHLDDGYRFKKAEQFGHVFFNQKHYIDQYHKSHEGPFGIVQAVQQVHYLPHAAEPKAYPHFEIIKKYDICFIGHIQEYHKDNGLNMSRIDVLDHLFKQFPNFYFGSRNPAFPDKNLFEDAAKKFCQSKVVFNISIGNDANMRLFETLVTGSLLLTNRIPELKNLEQYGFKEGVHYIAYSTLEEAEKEIRYFSDDSRTARREAIAKAGYEQALKTGTYESRIREIFNKIGAKIDSAKVAE